MIFSVQWAMVRSACGRSTRAWWTPYRRSNGRRACADYTAEWRPTSGAPAVLGDPTSFCKFHCRRLDLFVGYLHPARFDLGSSLNIRVILGCWWYLVQLITCFDLNFSPFACQSLNPANLVLIGMFADNCSSTCPLVKILQNTSLIVFFLWNHPHIFSSLIAYLVLLILFGW